MRTYAPVRVWSQCLTRQLRPQIRTANANVDHIGDTLPGKAGMNATAYGRNEFLHLCQHALHIYCDIAAIAIHRLVCA